MRAKDVMTQTVVTVAPEADVREIARTLLERRISAAPVVDARGTLLGIVSEGDLMQRPDSGTGRRPAWWLGILAGAEEQARAYIKSHGLTAADVMTRKVVTVGEDTPLADVAALLERRRIKRVPVMRDGRLVGIVSRADLLHGLAARPQAAPAPSPRDDDIKTQFMHSLEDAGVRSIFVNAMVADGVIRIWGAVESEDEKRAVHIAAEQIPGVKRIEDNVNVLSPSVRAVMWAE